MLAKVKKILMDAFYFVFGAGIALIVLALIVDVLGLLDKDGIVSEITAVAVFVLSIAFGVLVAMVKPKQKADEAKTTQARENAKPEQAKATTVPVEKPQIDPTVNVNTYKVAGITHYMDNIMELSSENYEYTMTKEELIESWVQEERIWKYEFPVRNVELVPEPDNAYDPNAIKVMVNDTHVGYIKSGSCAHLLKCIREHRIVKIGCKIGGGPYKVLREDYDIDKDKQVFTLERDETHYFVHLSVAERT